MKSHTTKDTHKTHIVCHVKYSYKWRKRESMHQNVTLFHVSVKHALSSWLFVLLLLLLLLLSSPLSHIDDCSSTKIHVSPKPFENHFIYTLKEREKNKRIVLRSNRSRIRVHVTFIQPLLQTRRQKYRRNKRKTRKKAREKNRLKSKYKDIFAHTKKKKRKKRKGLKCWRQKILTRKGIKILIDSRTKVKKCGVQNAMVELRVLFEWNVVAVAAEQKLSSFFSTCKMHHHYYNFSVIRFRHFISNDVTRRDAIFVVLFFAFSSSTICCAASFQLNCFSTIRECHKYFSGVFPLLT